MGSSAKYVGLDVHQATTVLSVRDGSGRVLARSVVATEDGALTGFLGSLRGNVSVALEEGTQAQWLHDLLEPVVARVVVCDRRGKARRGNKGDQVDADELSEALRTGALRAVYHGSPHQATLSELARAYRSVVADATRVMQRLKSLFRARGIKAPGARVYHPANRSLWLDKLPKGGARFRAEVLYAQLDALRELRPRVKATMVARPGRR